MLELPPSIADALVGSKSDPSDVVRILGPAANSSGKLPPPAIRPEGEVPAPTVVYDGNNMATDSLIENPEVIGCDDEALVSMHSSMTGQTRDACYSLLVSIVQLRCAAGDGQGALSLVHAMALGRIVVRPRLIRSILELAASHGNVDLVNQAIAIAAQFGVPTGLVETAAWIRANSVKAQALWKSRGSDEDTNVIDAIDALLAAAYRAACETTSDRAISVPAAERIAFLEAVQSAFGSALAKSRGWTVFSHASSPYYSTDVSLDGNDGLEVPLARQEMSVECLFAMRA